MRLGGWWTGFRLRGALVATLVVAACVKSQHRSLVAPEQARTLDHASAFLKVHARDGRAYILNPWQFDSAAATVTGTGQLLDANRRVLRDSATFTIPLDSVALLETNVLRTSGAATALTVFTGITAAVTVYCIANPKACFGSCPTFYVSDGTQPRLMAEGFSASVAPVLEARDVDALYLARPASRDLEVRMTNEALETHVVRYVRILAAPRPAGGRVFATAEGVLRAATTVTGAAACRAEEGDCLDRVATFDGRERFSAADSSDLAARETIEVDFDRPAAGGDLGLVLASRQTMLSTYLFYQGLAFMGRRAGDWIAALERAGPSVGGGGALRAVGRIEVQVPLVEGGWRTVGLAGETGPIATDVHLVLLPDPGAGRVRVRLRLTRGAWRLDWVALATLGGAVEPQRLDAAQVRRVAGDEPPATRTAPDSAHPLVTLPGDAWAFSYRLPNEYSEYELFLDTRGYYLEWMRQEWIAEEDQTRAAQLVLDPSRALKALAPEFKRREPALEDAFWRSRYVRP